MAEVVIVALALGGVSAYVWSVIDQASTASGGSPGHSSPRDSGAVSPVPPPLSARGALSRLRAWDLQARIRTAAGRTAAMGATAVGLARGGTRAVRARWARRPRPRFEREGRRIRFEETADLTVPAAAPVAGGVPISTDAGVWQDRPSRLLAALGLLLLIVVVGALLAAVIFGLGELVAGAVEGTRR